MITWIAVALICTATPTAIEPEKMLCDRAADYVQFTTRKDCDWFVNEQRQKVRESRQRNIYIYCEER